MLKGGNMTDWGLKNEGFGRKLHHPEFCKPCNHYSKWTWNVEHGKGSRKKLFF